MENDVAIRQLPEQVVTADVVAMAVGGENGVHRGDIDTEMDKNTVCLFQAGPVAGVDQNWWTVAIDKVVGVQIPPLDKKQILQDLCDLFIHGKKNAAGSISASKFRFCRVQRSSVSGSK